MVFQTTLKNPLVRLQNYVNSKDNKTFLRWALLPYFIFTASTTSLHEMWRDELDPWSVARDSPTMSTLIDNLKYVGHPPLWHIQLYFISAITKNPVAMQIYHLGLAIAAVCILLKYSPFTRTKKVLLSFSYFLCYEYAVISRSYAQGILLTFCLCAVLSRGRFKYYFVFFLILCLLVQTNIYGLIIAISFVAMFAFELLTDQEARLFFGKRKLILFSLFLVFVLSIIFSIAVIAPDNRSIYASSWNISIDFLFLKMTAATVWKSYVPVPQLTHHFWNTNIFTGETLTGTLGLLLFLFALLLFARKPPVLLLFCVGNLGALAVVYFKYYGFIRHHGHLFILLITCLWLSEYYTDRKISWPFFDRLQCFLLNYKSLVITVILIVQVAAGVFASAMDWIYPFSESKNAAQYIKSNDLKQFPMAGDKDSAAFSVAAYLNCQMYYPRTDKFGSFIIYDKKRSITPRITPQEILLWRIKQLSIREKSDILLVLDYEIPFHYGSILKLKEFTKSIQPDENFYLYLFKYSKQ